MTRELLVSAVTSLEAWLAANGVQPQLWGEKEVHLLLRSLHERLDAASCARHQARWLESIGAVISLLVRPRGGGGAGAGTVAVGPSAVRYLAHVLLGAMRTSALQRQCASLLHDLLQPILAAKAGGLEREAVRDLLWLIVAPLVAGLGGGAAAGGGAGPSVPSAEAQAAMAALLQLLVVKAPPWLEDRVAQLDAFPGESVFDSVRARHAQVAAAARRRGDRDAAAGPSAPSGAAAAGGAATAAATDASLRLTRISPALAARLEGFAQRAQADFPVARRSAASALTAAIRDEQRERAARLVQQQPGGASSDLPFGAAGGDPSNPPGGAERSEASAAERAAAAEANRLARRAVWGLVALCEQVEEAEVQELAGYALAALGPAAALEAAEPEDGAAGSSSAGAGGASAGKGPRGGNDAALMAAALRLLVGYAVDAEVAVVRVAADATTGLLSTAAGRDAMAAAPAATSGPSCASGVGAGSDPLTPLEWAYLKPFTPDARQTPDGFLEKVKRNQFQDVREPATWEPEGCKYSVWVRRVCSALLGECVKQRVVAETLGMCAAVAKRKPAMADLLLPHALEDLAAKAEERTTPEGKDELREALSEQVGRLLKNKAATQRQLSTVLNALSLLRARWTARQLQQQAAKPPGGRPSAGAAADSALAPTEPQPSQLVGNGTQALGTRSAVSAANTWATVHWLDVGYLDVADAALRCGAVFTALQYVEYWCEAQFGGMRLGRGEDVDPLDDTSALPRHVAILLDAHKQIAEPDNVYGALRIPHAAVQLRRMEHEGAWGSSLAANDLLLRQAGAQGGAAADAARTGVLRALQHLGCMHTLQLLGHALEDRGARVAQEILSETAWRMSQWSEMDSPMGLLPGGGDAAAGVSLTQPPPQQQPLGTQQRGGSSAQLSSRGAGGSSSSGALLSLSSQLQVTQRYAPGSLGAAGVGGGRGSLQAGPGGPAASAAAAAQGFNSAMCAALAALQARDPPRLQALLSRAREDQVRRIAGAGIESASTISETVVRLQMLDEVADLAERTLGEMAAVPEEGEVRRLLAAWDEAHVGDGAAVSYKLAEPLLAGRVAAVAAVGSDAGAALCLHAAAAAARRAGQPAAGLLLIREIKMRASAAATAANPQGGASGAAAARLTQLTKQGGGSLGSPAPGGGGGDSAPWVSATAPWRDEEVELLWASGQWEMALALARSLEARLRAASSAAGITGGGGGGGGAVVLRCRADEMLCRLATWLAERRDESASAIEERFFTAINSLCETLGGRAAGGGGGGGDDDMDCAIIRPMGRGGRGRAAPSQPPPPPLPPAVRAYAASALCRAQFQLAQFAEARCRVLDERTRSEEAQREARLMAHYEDELVATQKQIEAIRAAVRRRMEASGAKTATFTEEESNLVKALQERLRAAQANVTAMRAAMQHEELLETTAATAVRSYAGSLQAAGAHDDDAVRLLCCPPASQLFLRAVVVHLLPAKVLSLRNQTWVHGRTTLLPAADLQARLAVVQAPPLQGREPGDGRRRGDPHHLVRQVPSARVADLLAPPAARGRRRHVAVPDGAERPRGVARAGPPVPYAVPAHLTEEQRAEEADGAARACEGGERGGAGAQQAASAAGCLLLRTGCCFCLRRWLLKAFTGHPRSCLLPRAFLLRSRRGSSL